MQLKTTLRRIWNEEEGQALTEYGLIVGLIAVVCVAALTTMGSDINGLLGKISTALGKVPAVP